MFKLYNITYLHFSEVICLSDVITDENVMETEEQSNLNPVDEFLLQVLKLCPNVRSLELEMGAISDRSGTVTARGISDKSGTVTTRGISDKSGTVTTRGYQTDQVQLQPGGYMTDQVQLQPGGY